ncbi:helix-turn-helix domain-containing protein [Candidatus Pacearchaeota archaeon]|nr:helix-turn-helix domain-containing protein [Candidatus Pacearchaeota archaeon]
MIKTSAAVMITLKEVASIINITERTVIALDKNESLPEAIRIGTRIKRWRRKDILDWVAWDCPSRAEFNAIRRSCLKMCAGCSGSDSEKSCPNQKQADE